MRVVKVLTGAPPGGAPVFALLPLLPEVVQPQGGGLSGALPFADGGGDQDDGGNQERQGRRASTS